MLLNFWSTDSVHRKDYYKILGVSPNADQKQIKKAYFDVSITLYMYFRWLHYDFHLFIISPPILDCNTLKFLLCWPAFPWRNFLMLKKIIIKN